jgi:hypothetical protein
MVDAQISPEMIMGRLSSVTVPEKNGRGSKLAVTRLIVEKNQRTGKLEITTDFVEMRRLQCFADTTDEIGIHSVAAVRLDTIPRFLGSTTTQSPSIQ